MELHAPKVFLNDLPAYNTFQKCRCSLSFSIISTYFIYLVYKMQTWQKTCELENL